MCEAIVMVALVVIGFYLWNLFMPGTLDPKLRVPLLPTILFGLAAGAAIVAYFVTPTHKLTIAGLGNFLLGLIAVGALVFMTGGMTSSYLALLVMSIVFAGFFGNWGAILGLAALISLVVEQFLIDHDSNRQLMLTAFIVGLPYAIGLLLGGRAANKSDDTRQDRSYSELASELSAVTGKSEVVINAITDGVVSIDGKGLIQLINPAAQQLIGWPKNDSLGLDYKSVLKLLDSKNQPVLDTNNPVAQALANNHPVKNDSCSIETQSGKSFLASISVSPAGQTGSGVIVVFRDVTSEKSDERQRAEFISTASHEMRTPVASIEGYLGLALNPATATIDAKARDFITKAHESAQHLGRLFADLLDVSKADDSRLKNDPRIIDLIPFVYDIVEGLMPRATEKGLRMFYKPMPDGAADERARQMNPVFYVNVDIDHLREVVQNLVENAIKYTLKGEVIIDVTSGGTNDRVTISVADTGIGIPREDQGHLFQKFYRVDTSDTREIGGTGLGLYLCRRLTETIGGRIWVDSEYKKGSTFYVEIPRIEAAEAMRMMDEATALAEARAEQEQQQAIDDAQTASQEAAEALGMVADIAIDPMTATEPTYQQNTVTIAETLPNTPVQPAYAPPVTPPAAAAATPPVAMPQFTPPPPQPVTIGPPPAVAYTPPVQPAPTPAVAPPAAPIQPAPQFANRIPQPQAAAQLPNTPLTSIEANPSQYTRPANPSLNVPPRQ